MPTTGPAALPVPPAFLAAGPAGFPPTPPPYETAGPLSPYLIAENNAGSGSSSLAAAAVVANTPGGALAAWVTSGAANISGVSDPVNGAYTGLPAVTLAAGNTGQWFVCPGAQQLTPGQAVTLALTGSGSGKTLQVFDCPLAAVVPLDTVTPATGSGTSASVTSGPLAVATETALCGMVTGNAGGSPSWTAPFTQLGANQHAGAVQWGSAAVSQVSAGGTVTASATIGSANWGVSLITLATAGNTLLGDLAAVADTAAVAATIPSPDLAGVADVLSVSAQAVPAEQAAVGDALQVAASAGLGDTAGVADSFAVASLAGVADAVAVVDAMSSAVSVAQQEAAGVADTMQVSATVALPDAMAVADGVAVVAYPAAGFLAVVTPASPRWKAGPASRWAATPAQWRWMIVMTAFQPVAAISLEYVNVQWQTSLDGTTVDPTGASYSPPVSPLPVQFAFPVSSGNPLAPAQPSAWYDGVWLEDGTGFGYIAQCLIGPSGDGGVTQLIAGRSYDVWCQVIGSPEQPAKYAGTLLVY